MILAVDAGNSAVTLGCVEGRDILNLARLETSPGRSADEYAVLMERVLALRGVKYQEVPAGKLLSHNLLVYGLGGLAAPFLFIKLVDMLLVLLGMA